MKSINDIIENRTLSFEGLNNNIVERLQNLQDYYINECCCCGCDAKCCEPTCCCENSFIFFYSENEIVNKLKTDVKVQDIFNLHNQFGDRFKYVARGHEMDSVTQPLYFVDKSYSSGLIEGGLSFNAKFYGFVQKLVKEFKFTYPTVLTNTNGVIQLFFIMGGGTNGEECSIKSSLIKAVQTLNGLEEYDEINWAQILDVSIDNTDDVYNFVVTCTIEDKSVFDESPKSLKDYVIKTNERI